jgi:hypothetical protein
MRPISWRRARPLQRLVGRQLWLALQLNQLFLVLQKKNLPLCYAFYGDTYLTVVRQSLLWN